MKRSLLAGAAVVIAVASVAGCGGSASPTDTAAVTAKASLTTELLHESATAVSPFSFDDTQAQCAAGRVVDAIGPVNLQRYGLLDAQNHATAKTLDATTLSTQDATSVVTAVVDCLGQATFTNALTDAVSKSITGTKSASERACLESKLTVASLEPMLIASLSGNKSAPASFVASLAACLPKK